MKKFIMLSFVFMLLVVSGCFGDNDDKSNDVSEKKEKVELPTNEDIKYINNPEEENYPEHATPCSMDDKEFTHILDKRDNTTYSVTKIGEQCWMAENLRYTGNGCLDEEWNPHDETTNLYPSACRLNGGGLWDNDEVLYQWGAAMDGDDEGGQGLCPVGWYIPTHDNWRTLERAVCEEGRDSDCEISFDTPTDKSSWFASSAGVLLQDDVKWQQGENAFGFSALPVGRRDDSNSTRDLGSSTAYLSTAWWTSTSSNSNAWYMSLEWQSAGIDNSTISQAYGYSIRCLLEY